MPVYKRKNTSGKVVWRYQFTLGATREKQELFWKSGFATKQEAVAAETSRRAEEQVRKASAGSVAAPMPTTLAMLLEEFMQQHAGLSLAGTARPEPERDHAVESQSGVDSPAEVARPHPQDQGAAPKAAE